MLPDLLTLAARVTLVGGKGGVGKTTTAAALSVALAGRGREVVVISVDPAHSLGDALGMELGGEPEAVPGVPGLRALEVDAAGERERFLRTGRGSLLTLLQRGSYLDADDAAEVVDLTLPGLDELAAVFRLLDLTSRLDLHLVVDTAPTGHTLRLLEVPRLAREWLGALEAMEEKHRAVALGLAGAYQPDEAARFLTNTAADLERFSALLTDPALTRFLLVTNPEPVVLAETRRYAAALAERTIALAGIVVNRATGSVPTEALGAGMVFVPRLPENPRGVDGLRRFSSSACATPPAAPEARVIAAPGVRVGGAFQPPLDRSLYLVGGKGGVGKSTASAALALLLAERRPGPVLLLSTDPAGSLGDLLGQEVGAGPTPVEGAPALHVQQLDAALAWARFRDSYREEAYELFGTLGGGVSADADRAVVERLIDLAPPGVDELVALLEVVDVTEDRRYDPLVLDTAPTGHLLRLLELPDLALEWTHTLLRLLLKYREVVGLGSLADRVLRLAHSLRGFRARLSEPATTWFLAVALSESLAVPETRRLLDGIRGLHVPAGALLVNRLLENGELPRREDSEEHAAALLDLAGALPCAAAPDRVDGVRGVAALRDFADSWRMLIPATGE